MPWPVSAFAGSYCVLSRSGRFAWVPPGASWLTVPPSISESGSSHRCVQTPVLVYILIYIWRIGRMPLPSMYIDTPIYIHIHMNAFPVLPPPPLGYPGRTPDPSIVNLGRMAGYRLGFYPTHYGLGWGGFPGAPVGGWGPVWGPGAPWRAYARGLRNRWISFSLSVYLLVYTYTCVRVSPFWLKPHWLSVLPLVTCAKTAMARK